jgi:hypothetical protein
MDRRRRSRYVPQFDVLEDRQTPSVLEPTRLVPVLPTANDHDPAAAAAVAAPSSPLQSDPFGVAVADAIADPFPVNIHPPVKVHGLPVALHRQPYEW